MTKNLFLFLLCSVQSLPHYQTLVVYDVSLHVNLTVARTSFLTEYVVCKAFFFASFYVTVTTHSMWLMTHVRYTHNISSMCNIITNKRISGKITVHAGKYINQLFVSVPQIWPQKAWTHDYSLWLNKLKSIDIFRELFIIQRSVDFTKLHNTYFSCLVFTTFTAKVCKWTPNTFSKDIK